MITRSCGRRLHRLCFTAPLLVFLGGVDGEAADRARSMPSPLDAGFRAVVEAREIAQETISPGGRYATFVVTTPEVKSNSRRQDLYLATTDGSRTSRVETPAGSSPASTQWFSDGRRFAFLLRVGWGAQVYVGHSATGVACPVSNIAGGVDEYAISPDGEQMAVIAPGPSGRRIWLLHPAAGAVPVPLTDPLLSPGSLRWHPDGRRLFFLTANRPSGSGAGERPTPAVVHWQDPPRSPRHIRSVDVVTRQERPWTTGTDFTVLTFEIASNGARLAFQTNTVERPIIPGDENRATLRILDLEDATARTLVPALGGPNACSYAFSPDGRTLAFVAPGASEYRRFRRIFTLDAASGRQQAWLERADMDARTVFWNESSDMLFFTAYVGVNRPWFALRLADGSCARVSGESGMHSGRYVAAAKSLISVYSNSRRPHEVLVATASTLRDPMRWAQLSHVNAGLAALPMAGVRIVRWASTDGREIEGLLFEPIGYRRGQRYPLIVQVNGAYDSFPSHYQSYAHVLASRGYLVFQMNHRGLGATGYGEAFKLESYPPNEVLDDATEDILTGVESLVRDGVADGDRVGLMGWSIGGFTANWLTTRSARFKAISAGAGNSDMVAAYGQIEQYRYHYRNSWGGSAFRSWDYYADHSPLRFIERARTPMLIHVGENDDGVAAQCRETYNALKEFGVPVEMLVHVGQPHILQAPQSLLAKILAEFHWFEQWVRGGSSWLEWQDEFDAVVSGR